MSAPPSPPARATSDGSESEPTEGRLRRWLVDRYSGQARSELEYVKRELDQTRRLLGLMFERATDGFVLCGAQGQIVACNPRAAQILGEAPEALAGQPLVGRVVQYHPTGPGPLRSGEVHVRRPDGSLLPADMRVSDLPGGAPAQVLVQLHDLSDRRRAEDRLLHLANYDSLTGLPNRALFRERLARAMARARQTHRAMALMFLDLDRFKVVNDSLGHEAGDGLLKHVAQALTGCLRRRDTVARAGEDDGFTVSRLGGDEFTVIAEGIAGSEDAALIAQRLLEALSAPFACGNEEIVVSASIGITIYPTDDVDLDSLVRHTDMAMYRAKSLGRGMYCFFSDDLSAAVTARLSLEGSLRRAIERQEFILHYQPKADLRDGRITGVEALLRWHCPGRGMVPPDRFIAVLEETGLILPVGAWVIRTAIAQLAEWDRQGLPLLRLAINVSARQFRHQYLPSMVADTLREYGIVPSRIEIELTESLLMEDTEATRAMLANFKHMGLRLALDDFGTGHSSLAYLKRFNLHTLKIDRSFVNALPNNVEDTAIASAVIALGRTMNMSVVAEGVETEVQAEALREMGCNEIQGYLLSRPLDGNDLAHWLRERLKRMELARLAHAQGQSLQRIDILVGDDDVWEDTDGSGIATWALGGGRAPSLKSPHASHGTEPATARRPEPGAARGGDAAGAAGADPGRRRLGQDAGADDAHRLAAGPGPGHAGAGVRGHLHEQGRQGDADASVGHAAGERARHVDRHLPRPGQPLPARPLEAGRAAAELPDP
jgi:diguanylate cyclase (GGDEF)-like protein/PAS domain S-box-containing protein